MPDTEASEDRGLFSRLRRSYLIALSLIALALIVEQFLVDGFLQDQENDADIINVAGRQRMLSQRIAKRSILPGVNSVEAETEEWLQRHESLKRQLFDHPVYPRLNSLDTIMTGLLTRVDSLSSTRARPQGAKRVADEHVTAIDQLSDDFLQRMDAIVAEVSLTATAKVSDLQRTKRVLTLIALGILLLELLFIFLPISRFASRQLSRLAAEKAAQEEARAVAEAAVAAKEQSLRELRSLNQAIDQAAVFATLRRDGSIIYLSRKFQDLLGFTGDPTGRFLNELLHEDEGQRAYYANLLQDARAAAWQGEWELPELEEESRWLEVSLVPARQRGSDTDLFLLATDVTERKRARAALDALNQERLAEEVERGKQRSRQIVEAQEKERLRVARDLHDGIGQKLTALKFGLEGLRPTADPEKTVEKISQLKELSKEIILSIRMATFNLSPPELTDYGLIVALEKMASELSRLTSQRIVFQNKGFTGQIEGTRAVNLYRVVQEAVNNAIKYAGANYILVSLSAGDDLLSITVDDDGQGFDDEDLEKNSDGTGLGLANMKDRIGNLNGRIFMRSSPESGTRITINVPV